MLRCLLCLLNLKCSLVIWSASYIIFLDAAVSIFPNPVYFFVVIETFVAKYIRIDFFSYQPRHHLLKIFWTKDHVQNVANSLNSCLPIESVNVT